MPSNPYQTVPPTEDQVFKRMGLWEAVSFTPPHSWRLKAGARWVILTLLNSAYLELGEPLSGTVFWEMKLS